MAIVLLIDQDNKTKELLEQAFTARRAEIGEVTTIIKADSFDQITEMLVGIVFDVVLIDQSFFGNSFFQAVEDFKLRFPTLRAPMMLLGHETNPQKVIRYLDVGFVDYIVKPVDKPLLLEKIFLVTSGTRLSANREFYSLAMSQPIDVARTANLDELSEFDCKLTSSVKYSVGECAVLYSKLFIEATHGEAGYVIGRCYRCDPSPLSPGMYEVNFNYVGIQPSVLKQIRSALMKEYINKKS